MDAAESASGGSGLYHQRAADPFPRWAGFVAGLAVFAFTAVVAGTLYSLNPAFQSGAYAGAGDQLGPTPAPVGQDGAEGGADAAAARRIIGQKGCGGCHVIPGIPSAKGAVGPSLAGVGSRQTIAGGAVPNTSLEDLTAWLLDPPALKPGTAMPNLGLTQEEATTVAGFLRTLR